MAEAGESAPKASEFYLGIVDLFAVVLPGAIIVFVVERGFALDSRYEWLKRRSGLGGLSRILLHHWSSHLCIWWFASRQDLRHRVQAFQSTFELFQHTNKVERRRSNAFGFALQPEGQCNGMGRYHRASPECSRER